MIIKNKKTGLETFVTLEGWTSIKANILLKDKFVLVDSKEIMETITAPTKKPIIPQEILDLRKKIVEDIKNKDIQAKKTAKKTTKK